MDRGFIDLFYALLTNIFLVILIIGLLQSKLTKGLAYLLSCILSVISIFAASYLRTNLEFVQEYFYSLAIVGILFAITIGSLIFFLATKIFEYKFKVKLE